MVGVGGDLVWDTMTHLRGWVIMASNMTGKDGLTCLMLVVEVDRCFFDLDDLMVHSLFLSLFIYLLNLVSLFCFWSSTHIRQGEA